MSGYGATRYVPMSYYDSLADARKTLKENSLTSLEFQTDLLGWLGRPNAVAAYQQFMQAYGYKKISDQAQREVLGQFLHDTVQEVIGSASTFYVSPDMCELVKMAAADMPASGLLPTDVITDTGFLVFDRPVAIKADYGPISGEEQAPAGGQEDIRIAAIAWRVGTVRQAPVVNSQGQAPGFSDGDSVPGISYFLFATPHDMAVTMNQGFAEEGSDERVYEHDIRRENGPLPIYDFSGWSFNTPWHATTVENFGHAVVEGAAEPLAGVHSVVDQARRLMLAAWRILSQENIVVLDPNRPPRPMRRRAERVGLPEDGDIVIIRMRREVFQGLKKAAGGEDEEPWYTIRFLVRGHWHNYWVGPRGQQHLIAKYILPYEKGPEGAPLVRKDKIFSLER